MYDNNSGAARVANALHHDDYAAKERASQGAIGLGTGAATPRDATVAEVLLRELDQACSLLNETATIQQMQKDRFFGPGPIEKEPGNKAPSPQSIQGQVEERLMWLRGLTQRVYGNANDLNRIG